MRSDKTSNKSVIVDKECSDAIRNPRDPESDRYMVSELAEGLRFRKTF